MDGESGIHSLRRFLPSAAVVESLREKLSQYDKLSRQLESYQEFGGSPENIELTLNLISAIIESIEDVCSANRITKPLRYNGLVVMRRSSLRALVLIRDDDCIDISREIRVCKAPEANDDQELPF